jgi:hypothetical protein
METRVTILMNRLRGLIWMFMAVGGIVSFLAAANWTTSLVQKDFARQYETIEEAQRSLGLGAVMVPTYFPDGTSWPPSFIVAQNRPYQAVVMEFSEAASRKMRLTIIQSSSGDSIPHLQRVRISELQEETAYRVKGRQALLSVGICDNGRPCSSIVWQEGGVHCAVIGMLTPFELTRISESMLR